MMLGGMAGAASALIESRAEARLKPVNLPEILLIDFRPDSIRGWKVESAKLFLYLTQGTVPPSIRVSTIAARWTEADPQPAAGAIFGGKDSVSGECRVKDLEQGWMEVELPAAVREALGSGKSTGLAIEQKEIRINGRAPVFRQPYILTDGQPPPAVP